MRTKGSTAKAKAQKKRNGDLPRWATKEISLLAQRTGISFERVVEMVAGFGIYRAKEELTPLGNLMDSAVAMATLKEEEQPYEQEHEQPSVETPDQERGRDLAGPLDSPVCVPGISDDLGGPPDQARTGYVEPGLGGHPENSQSAEYFAALSGE